jgi:hypothetical protein
LKPSLCFNQATGAVTPAAKKQRQKAIASAGAMHAAIIGPEVDTAIIAIDNAMRSLR